MSIRMKMCLFVLLSGVGLLAYWKRGPTALASQTFDDHEASQSAPSRSVGTHSRARIPHSRETHVEQPDLGVQATVQEVLDGQQSARHKLEALGIDWDAERIKQVPESADAELPVGLAQELAQRFGVTDLEFVEHRENGLDVYKSADGKVTVKSDSERGYWKLQRAMSTELAAERLTPAQVQDRAEELSSKFEVPQEQRGAVRDSALLGSPGYGQDAVVGHRVDLQRSVNGLRVDNSHVMALYDEQETPITAEAQWPRFRQAPVENVKSVDEALDAVSAALAQRFAGDTSAYDLKHKVTYQLNESGEYEPVLSVALFDYSQEGAHEVVEYSLLSGLDESSLGL